MRVSCIGELLIDFVALESGVTVGEASGFEKKAGGAPANVAVAVKRLGGESAFLGQVGDDAFGHFLSDVLKNEGVDVSGLRFSQEARTMLAFVSLQEDGERSFMFYRHPSADMMMTPDDVARDVIESSDLFHFGSITLISSPSKEATLAAAEIAKNAGKFISYDPNLRLALWDSVAAARKGMRLGLEYAHIVKISEEEVTVVLEESEAIEDLFVTFPQMKLVLLTHGARGSTVYIPEGKRAHISGYHVETIDTTGAGDSFMAAILVGVLEQIGTSGDFTQLDYRKLLRFANASGALATKKRGAIPALPSREQVDDFTKSEA
jgi:fructokinase